MCVCMYVCIYVRTYVCMYVCMCVCKANGNVFMNSIYTGEILQPAKDLDFRRKKPASCNKLVLLIDQLSHVRFRNPFRLKILISLLIIFSYRFSCYIS